MRSILGSLGALFVLAVVIGFGISSTTSVPAAATMWVDPIKRQYASPPCLAASVALRHRFTVETTEAAVKATWKTGNDADRLWPNPECRDQGGFTGPSEPLIASVIPYFKPRARWSADGEWLW